jgi:CRISPR system Cascade subunit CasE
MASKPLPERWEKGSRFKFEVRASPIQRLGKSNRLGKPGAEVDAFLAHCWREGVEEGANRAEVYVNWLRNETARLGGASLLQVDLASFQLERLLRRTQGEDRKGQSVTRPVVTFKGVLEVQDSERFRAMLERGIGRHRAFGLGMLLLRA